MIKINKCFLCGSKEFKLLFYGRDRMFYIPGSFRIEKCEKCGLIFINPSLENAEIAKYYPQQEYYSLNKNRLEDFKIWLYRVFYSNNLYKQLVLSPLKLFVRGVSLVDGGKILDVGCGDGKFLYLIRDYNMDCYGVDPYNQKPIYDNNLRIFNKQLERVNFKSSFFDVITLNHVIEHIIHPKVVFQEISRILKSGGKLIIATPNTNSLVAKLFKNKWAQLDSPRHLFLYSEKNLKNFAKSFNFKIVRIKYNSTPFQFTGSICILFESFFGKNKIFRTAIYNNPLLFFLFLPLAHVLNMFETGDQLEIELKKV